MQCHIFSDTCVTPRGLAAAASGISEQSSNVSTEGRILHAALWEEQ